MFKNAESSGRHMFCDIKKISNTKLLNNKLDLKLLCKDICIEKNFTILGEVDHDFHPQGCSFIFLLSESHLSVHTFPERNHLSFDLYTCRQYPENDTTYIEIYNILCKKLEASFVASNYKVIDRYF
jgi:S-adenosylmethionine decarboxylase